MLFTDLTLSFPSSNSITHLGIYLSTLPTPHQNGLLRLPCHSQKLLHTSQMHLPTQMRLQYELTVALHFAKCTTEGMLFYCSILLFRHLLLVRLANLGLLLVRLANLGLLLPFRLAILGLLLPVRQANLGLRMLRLANLGLLLSLRLASLELLLPLLGGHDFLLHKLRLVG